MSTRYLRFSVYVGWAVVAAGVIEIARGVVEDDSGVIASGGFGLLMGVLIVKAFCEARAERCHADQLQRVVDDLDVTFVEHANGSRTYTVNRYDDSE